MQPFIRYTILANIILFIVLSFPQSLKAQDLTGTFIMSSIRGIPNQSNNSMAVTFYSNAHCLNIQNGTAVLNGERGTGNFAIHCEVNMVFNQLGIILYPNPVDTYTKVKFIHTPPLNDQFSVSIWNSEGMIVGNATATGDEIFQGKTMNFSQLVAGTYLFQIESATYRDAIKFIKIN